VRKERSRIFAMLSIALNKYIVYNIVHMYPAVLDSGHRAGGAMRDL
jgi:hypothetical protein